MIFVYELIEIRLINCACIVKKLYIILMHNGLFILLIDYK